ncbi:hypothetical protein [Flavobacterium piscis]|uniref:Uncharacterized protein n=1 Tax=Flavobacterium piscis TaxID=1114874 RepID=A0ABU1YCW5_9FLAO|nr:hypothetical protein [Flavobacterium piscis]MDR7212067.1 hypothetical protein [Flavobacterium piscis]
MPNKKYTFPLENTNGSVTLVDDKIHCKGNLYFSNSEVTIDRIQYVYVVVNAKKESLLFIFDHHQHTIPTTSTGFEVVYTELSKRFLFDDALFFETISKQEQAKKQIWRRTYVPTYAILQAQHSDYHLGFEILSPEPQFISWDISFAALEKNDSVFRATSPYGQTLLTYKYPIRIGSIKLYDVASYFDEVRMDAPVLEFHTDCFDQKGSDKSYSDLKEVLVRDLGLNANKAGYERADQKNIHFDVDNMSVSICYTYDSAHMYNGGYTSFTIQNRRTYPELLVNAAYENKLVVSAFLLIGGSVTMRNDYKKNDKIKRRPPIIANQFKDKTIIWMDDVNDKIGFASGAFSQVYSKDEIKAFSIRNTLPARGRGGSTLALILEQDVNHYEIFSQECHFFNRLADTIMQLTNKELTFEPEYYDC